MSAKIFNIIELERPGHYPLSLEFYGGNILDTHSDVMRISSFKGDYFPTDGSILSCTLSSHTNSLYLLRNPYSHQFKNQIRKPIMFFLNPTSNSIHKVRTVTFKELGFRERDHLQEWIAKNPSCLNEELLIIQKEFSGFKDTNERLDLLALDKQGNLVVIGNKLDDSGREVAWQVLKYASYCSSLSTEDITQIYNSYLGDNTA